VPFMLTQIQINQNATDHVAELINEKWLVPATIHAPVQIAIAAVPAANKQRN